MRSFKRILKIRTENLNKVRLLIERRLFYHKSKIFFRKKKQYNRSKEITNDKRMIKIMINYKYKKVK